MEMDLRTHTHMLTASQQPSFQQAGPRATPRNRSRRDEGHFQPPLQGLLQWFLRGLVSPALHDFLELHLRHLMRIHRFCRY